jgi:O-antigen ligase
MLYFFDVLGIFFEADSSLNRFVLLSGLMAASVLCAIKRRLAIKVLRLSWPILPLILWFWVTSYWSEFPGLTRQRSITLGIVYLTALGLAVGMQSPRGFQVAIFWPACIVVLADVISLAFPETSHSDIGIKGIHINKNIAGFIAITCGTVIGFAWPQLRGNGTRFVAVGTVILATIFLIYTESKTNLFVLVIISVMLGLYLFLVRFRKAQRIHFILACLFCALLFIVGSSGSKLSWLGKLYGDPTLTDRLEIWVEMEYLIAESRWKGLGYGAFWSTGQEANGFPIGYYAFYNDPLIVNSGHNGYLDILLQGGRPALLIAYVVVAQSFCFALMLVTSPAVPMHHKWTFCMLNCLIMMAIVQNLTESSIFFPADTNSYIFMTYLAQLVRWRADLT